MKLRGIFVLTLLLHTVVCGSDDCVEEIKPITKVEQGKLMGKQMRSVSGKPFYAFQGIPYAAPPIGSLRFKPPRKPKCWRGVRLAEEEGCVCPQVNFYTLKYEGEEDCLFLNIYTPTLDCSAKLSVLVVIHEGKFSSGSGGTEIYGPEFMMEQDLVMVTMNYRLGALGYLTLGEEHATGNYGLKDQRAALRWVKRNIRRFGGNPKSVTLFGRNTGGASIQFHMISPLSRGLFHGAIGITGSALSPWSFHLNVTGPSVSLAERVGCRRSTLHKTHKCLTRVEPKKLVMETIALEKELNALTLMVPTVEPEGAEDVFLVEDPLETLTRGNIADVPYIVGIAEKEGILMFQANRDLCPSEDLVDNRKNFVAGLGCKEGSKGYNKIWRKMDKFYSSMSDGSLLDKYLLLSSDVNFVNAFDQSVRLIAKANKSPVFYFYFTYQGGLNFFTNFRKIKHPGSGGFDELGYLFTQSLVPAWKKACKRDLQTSKSYTTLFRNFAYYRDPTPSGCKMSVVWDPVKVHSNGEVTTRYLNFGNELSMVKDDVNCERRAFWRKLLRCAKKYCCKRE